MKRSTKVPGGGAGLPAWFGAMALMAAVFLAYLPVWHAGFVWDDRAYIEHNPYLDDLRGLKAIWTSSAADISPLAFTTFWIEHALWGLAPLPYHLVNVLQHSLCAVLLWRVLLALRVDGAWLGAGLWALHPVNVESVAWVSELKNTQSGLFFLLAILSFIRWLSSDEPAPWHYVLTFLSAALAMATKSSTVILPGVLCLVAWWIEGRWAWRNLARVAPIAALSVAASLLSLWTQSIALATIIDPTFVRPWAERVATAGIAVWFYLGKLVWPIPVMTGYPRWHIDVTSIASWLPVAAVVVALFLLWRKRDSWGRAPFLVFAYFVGVLVPVLGLLDNYIFQYSLVFDHFQYLPSMGPLAWAGAGLARLGESGPVWRTRLAAVLWLGLGTLTWLRAATFTSEETLWAHTAAEYPDSWLAHQNLAIALGKEGRTGEAIRHYLKAIEVYPTYPEAHVNLGVIYLEQGQTEAALAEFRTALKFNPRSGEAYVDIGNVRLQQGRQDEALAAFEEAMKVAPTLVTGACNAGHVLLQKGQIDAAIAAYERAVNIDPHFAAAYSGLAGAFQKKGDIEKAIIGYRRSVELDPDNIDYRVSLGAALVQKGELNDGVAQYQEALAINPNSAPAETNLGVALFQAGFKVEAMKHLRRALELDPASAEANNNLGNAWLAGGQLDAAIAQYQKALRLDATLNEAHRNLGVALLYRGRPGEAMVQFEEVLRINPGDTVTQGLLAKAKETMPPPPRGK